MDMHAKFFALNNLFSRPLISSFITKRNTGTICLLFLIVCRTHAFSLTPLITSSSQLSSNASDAVEGTHIEYLIDGNPNTFWHTDWHNSYDSNNPHYVQVALNQKVSGYICVYLRRRNSQNDHPTKMLVTGSPDGTRWKEMANLSFPFEGPGTESYSDVVEISPACKYFRLIGTDCTGIDIQNFRGFWHTAELQIYSMSAGDATLLLLQTGIATYSDYLKGKTFDIGTDTGQFSDGESADEFMKLLRQAQDILDGKADIPSYEEAKTLVESIQNRYNAVMASEVLFNLKDGYYRVLTNLQYYVINNNGEKEYVTKAMYSDPRGYGSWGTLDEHDLAFVWKLTQKTGGIEMLNMGTDMQFKSMGSPVTMSKSARNLMAFDIVGRENGHTVIYIRMASTPKNEENTIYLHQWYHSCGTGTGANMCSWRGTWTLGADKGTSEWYIEGLSEEEIQAIDGITNEVHLSADDLSLEVGEEYTLDVSLVPSNNYFHKVSWYSDNTSVATVDGEGHVKATGVGKTKIHATANDAGGASAECTIRVTKTPATKENLIINEIQSANIDCFMDPSWNYGGWVELYNPSDRAVNIAGFWISDDASNLKKHHINQGVGPIPAHGFRNLWFDHHDMYCLTQIDDKLDVEGGTVYISDEQGTLIVSQEYPAAVSRCSYARKTDGGNEWGTTAFPTPAASNSSSRFAETRLEAPHVNLDPQLFEGSLSVQVDIPQGATLRYTTNGSTPSLKNGQTSETGLFKVTGTTVFRFCLFQEGFLPSRVVTRSYILRDKEFNIPIVSVNTNSDNIYSTEYGIFAKGPNGRSGNGQSEKCNWNMEWERPVNMEFFNEDGQVILNQEADFAACGGWSRAWEPHSFELKANKMYELENRFEAPILPTKPYNKYRSVKFRNGGNDNTCRIKDPAIQEIIRTSGFYVDTQGYYPTCVFINGTFMGTLNLREPNNKDYGLSNYGYDTDYMDSFEISPDSDYVQKKGTKEAFNRLVTLCQNAANESNYQEILKLLDIDEYTNYMAAELYLGATDWLSNNVKGFRSLDPEHDGRFHIVMFDTDSTLGTEDPFNRLLGFGNDFTRIFKGLVKNKTWAKKLVDTYCLVGGSVCEPERVDSVVRAMATKVEKMQKYANYYGNGNSPWSTANSVISSIRSTSRRNNMIRALKNYSALGLSSKSTQSVKFRSNIPDAGILLNDMQVPTGRFDGSLFAPITLTAQAPAGYTFLGWLDGKTQELLSADSVFTLPTRGDLNLVATYEKMPEEQWLASGATPVKINEMSGANERFMNDRQKKTDWIELYNTTDHTIDLAGMYLTDNFDKPQKYQIPAQDSISTKIPPHGFYILWADKKENRTQLHTGFEIDKDGGSLMLTSQDGTWKDILSYPAHTSEQSIGLYPDGSNYVYTFSHPTIEKGNLVGSYSALFEKRDPQTSVQPLLPDGELSADIVRIEYYDAAGLQLSAPRPGINLVRRVYRDGHTSTQKLVVSPSATTKWPR